METPILELIASLHVCSLALFHCVSPGSTRHLHTSGFDSLKEYEDEEDEPEEEFFL